MIWLVRRPVEKLAMQSKKDFGLELILMKVPLYCYSFILAKVMVSKPILENSSGVEAECPKASRCQACLGVIPKVFFRKACPVIIFSISSS